MVKGIKVIQFRRKQKGMTDYRKRLNLLLGGLPRVVVRRSNKNIWLQLAEYQKSGDRIIVSAHTAELKQLGWKTSMSNIPAAYLCGLLFGRKAKEAKISRCIADTGFYPSVRGNRIYAALKGVVDAGLNLLVDPKMFPVQERLSGRHVSSWAQIIKGKNNESGKQFAGYIKAGIDPGQLPAVAEEVKRRIMEQNGRRKNQG